MIRELLKKHGFVPEVVRTDFGVDLVLPARVLTTSVTFSSTTVYLCSWSRGYSTDGKVIEAPEYSIRTLIWLDILARCQSAGFHSSLINFKDGDEEAFNLSSLLEPPRDLAREVALLEHLGMAKRLGFLPEIDQSAVKYSVFDGLHACKPYFETKES